MICPSLRRKKVEEFCSRPIAHRGAHDDETVGENSLSAFSLAVERGFGIELDVRITSDGEPIVMHDPTLMRMCGVDKSVSSITLEELRKYPLMSGEQVPTLKEALETIGGRVPLIIELKGDGGESFRLAEKTAGALTGYKGEYAVESFDPRCVFHYRKLSPGAARGILAQRRRKKGEKLRERIAFSAAGALLFNFLARPDFIAYRYSDGVGFNMRLCRLLGAKTVAWTIRSAEEYNDAATSYDAIIGENILSYFDLGEHGASSLFK